MTKPATTPAASFEHGLRLRQQKRLAEAEQIFRTLLAENPRAWDAMNQLGFVLAERQKPTEALQWLTKSLALHPGQPEIHLEAGRLCRLFNRTKDAMAHFNEAMKRAPERIEAYLELAQCFMEHHRHDVAEKVLRTALHACPPHPLTISALVTAKQQQGRGAEAIALCREGLAQHPDNILLFCQLTELTPLEAVDPLVARAKQQLKRRAKHPADRYNLPFALAKVYDRQGDYEKAFGYYLAANNERGKTQPYDAAAEEAYFRAIKDVFSKDEGPVVSMASSPTPIFIVGMPRSGTTLVEQILASHSDVHGAGELPHLRVIAEILTLKHTGKRYPESIRALDAGLYAPLAENYLSQLRALAKDKAYVCDKMPQNFLYTGLIRRLFPSAKIIHCRRDPMDTCFSIFTYSFAGTHPYAYDLASIGHYYRLYEDLMQHFNRAYPGQIHTVNYESLVNDFEPNVRALLEFCGLPWQEACLNFHNTERVVKTLSTDQVRKPLYTSSIGKWKRYEKFLGPLKEALAN